MTDLPPGWEWTTLGEIGDYVNGRGFRKDEWSDTGRPIVRIQNLTGTSTHFNRFAGHVEEKNLARRGDLLMSWAASLGVHVWEGPEAAVNQHIFKITSRINPAFHRLAIDFALSKLSEAAHGTGMVHVTRPRFEATSVALPPLDEQRRLVEEIDDHSSGLRRARSMLLDVDRRSTALRRRLVDDAVFYRGHIMRLADLLETPLMNGRSVPTRNGGFPVLRLTALTATGIDTDQQKDGDWEPEEARPFLIKEGDFLVSRGSGSLTLVGRGALVRERPVDIAFPDTMIRVRSDRRYVDSEYLALAWGSFGVRRQIESRAKTTAGIHKISQRDLNAIELAVPTLADQRRLVKECRRELEAVDRLQVETAAALNRDGQLRTSLLQAAFRGKLTRQDPADEPAAALLDRIRTERATGATATATATATARSARRRPPRSPTR